jgi:peptidase M28-like protein
MPLLDQKQLRERVERLSQIERPSASEGEAQAAELIAAELRERGARVQIDSEDAHGTYWWPIGLLTGAAAAAGLFLGRLPAVFTGLFAAGAVTDDITGGRQWFRRTFLPMRTTTNVVAEMGPADAPRTIVVGAHHDAAHTGLVFAPDLPRKILSRYPKMVENAKSTPGTMWGSVIGPLAVSAGALLGARRLRRFGALSSLAFAAAMVDIGVREVVPGANDNITGVAVLLSLAAALEEEPIENTRVILLSAGSEESFMEGMQAFGRRHFGELPVESTTFICVDTVGSPNLLALEGEGMVWMNEYPKDLLETAHGCASELGVPLMGGLRLRNATDGLIALRAGYPTITFGSVDDLKIPSNYHWPTDTADRVDYSTVEGCASLVHRLLGHPAFTAIPRA